MKMARLMIIYCISEYIYEHVQEPLCFDGAAKVALGRMCVVLHFCESLNWHEAHVPMIRSACSPYKALTFVTFIMRWIVFMASTGDVHSFHVQILYQLVHCNIPWPWLFMLAKGTSTRRQENLGNPAWSGTYVKFSYALLHCTGYIESY